MSATGSTTSSIATSTSTAEDFSFIGNTPLSVLFFLALAVGVFIALLFIFFTLRYFIRSKYGLHVYPVAQRSVFANNGLTATTNISMMYHTNAELEEQLRYIREHHFVRADVLDRRLNSRRRRRRRRRNRFSKMKKLTETQVQTLFPKKTYHDWLNGGKERDTDIRDGVLQEEGYNEDQNQISTQKTDTTITDTDMEGMVEINGEPTSDNNNKIQDNIELGDLSQLEGNLHFTSGTCAICLEIIEDEDIVRGLLCGHVFHAICLDPWLTKRRACCPTCKRDYYHKDSARRSSDDNDTELTGNDLRDNDNNDNNNNNNNNDNDNNDTGDHEVRNETRDNVNETRENETRDEANNGGNEGNVDEDDSDDDSIDLEAFRSDPTLRAMLHELIPVEERVRMILQDESLADQHLEAGGNEIASKKYSNIFKIIFWKIMGISKTDLFNYGVLTLYHDYRVEEERRNTSNQPMPNLDTTVNNTPVGTQTENISPTTTVPVTNTNGPEISEGQEQSAERDLGESNITASLYTANSPTSSIERDIVNNRV